LKGLVHQVVPIEEIDDVAIEWARKLATYDSEVVRALKRTLREGSDLPLDAAVAAEKIQSVNIVARTQ
jgi:enoyl-CoA hydratase/carnithine racemase